MTQKERDPDRKADTHWPEPPGYLGEAVRRAKRIPSRTEPMPPPATPEE